MDIHALGASHLRRAQQRMQMRLLRVHAAIREQPQQMQLPPLFARAVDRPHNLRMLVEAAVRDHRIDTRDVHRHHAARADVQMPDFAVAHLPIRQPDKVIRSMQQCVGKLAQQPVVIRFSRLGNCVCVTFRAISPPVQNGQHQRFSHRRSHLSSRVNAIRTRHVLLCGANVPGSVTSVHQPAHVPEHPRSTADPAADDRP